MFCCPHFPPVLRAFGRSPPMVTFPRCVVALRLQTTEQANNRARRCHDANALFCGCLGVVWRCELLRKALSALRRTPLGRSYAWIPDRGCAGFQESKL